jgi:hypothetical protein
MRARHRRLIGFALAGLLAAGASPAVATQTTAAMPNLPSFPGLPKAPKVTGYWATIDVAGYVKVRITENYARECTPGRDTLAEFEADFELGAPQRARVVVVNGNVSSNGVRSVRRSGAGAVHKGKFTVTRETNNCAPTARVELAPPPVCKPALRGRLQASLFPTPRDDGSELTPLVRRVSVNLQRIGGGRQSNQCLGLIPGLRAKVREEESSIHPMYFAQLPLSVPIATDAALLKLKKGKMLRRSIGLSGACDGIILSGGPVQSQDGYTCTVKGRIVVNIKRTS